MAELRIGRGWSPRELADRLGGLRERRTSFPKPDLEVMTPERGWHAERMRVTLGSERPGPPRPGGVFERAWAAVADYGFSDPQIVTGHFVSGSELLGRRMLLEIKVLGLRYLCGVVVGAVKNDQRDGWSRRGFRYDTLVGHIEEGSEWFEVEKDHASGRVWLHVRSRWRRGQFPNWWSELGFVLLAGRYRALWLRRGHHRLRALIEVDRRTVDKEESMEHREPSTVTRSGRRALVAAAGAGALAGVRSMAAPTLVAARSMVSGPHAGTGRGERLLARPGTTALFGIMAAGEMVADKLPGTPPRTSPLALAGRLASGAISALLLGRDAQRPVASAATGAASAGASAVASYRLRRAAHRRGLASQVTLGLVEDALVLGGAALLWRMLSRPSPRAGQVDAAAAKQSDPLNAAGSRERKAR